MENIKLLILKKEILKLDVKTLADICTRLAKYKKENKEFLNYLLFHNYDNQLYIDELKMEIKQCFEFLPNTEFRIAVSLKKLLSKLNKHLKFVSDKSREAEIVCEFCNTFIEKINMNGYYTPLIQILYRQYIKLRKIVDKLDEDLQFDYQNQIDSIYKALKQSRYYKDLRVD